MKTRNVNIDWNQNSGHEQGESHVKSTTTSVQTEEDAKQNEDKESRRCRETKDEEQGWDANADRTLNEAEAPSVNLRSFGIHGRVCVTPNA